MSIRRTVPVLALLSSMSLAGCAAEGAGDDPRCHGGKCDDPRDDPSSSFEKLAELSERVTNGDSLPRGFAVVDGAVLFFSGARKGLYRTDGTPDGTRLVRDLEPTLDSFQATPSIAVLDDRAYWSQAGALWTSDGTPEGTHRVMFFGTARDQEPTPPFVYDGALFFGSGLSLFRSDGTAAGTEEIATLDVVASDTNPHQFFQIVGDALYFICDLPSAATGQELCVTDGTAPGTRVVDDIRSGSASSSPRILGRLGSKVLFSAQVPEFLRGLWVSDGTSAGTLQLLAPASNGDAVRDGAGADFAVLGDEAFLPCYTQATGFELCRTNGTPEGTSVIDLVPGTGSAAPGSFAVLGTRIFFVASSPSTGREVWSSDGTEEGTAPVFDIYPGSSSGVSITRLIPMGGSVYFAAQSGFESDEIWKTDGTAAGTVQVADILPSGQPQRYPPNLYDSVVLGTRLIFAGDDGVHGLEPWVTDGSAAGTHLLGDLTPEATESPVFEAAAFGRAVYLSVQDDGGTVTAWRTDGTVDGTAPLHQLDSQGALGFTAVGSQLFYAGRSGGKNALWKADGTETGFAKVVDLPGSASELHAVGSRLAFAGSTPSSAVGLWVSDGSAAGTKLTSVVNARRLGVANGKLWLTGLDGALGNELWVSDGTTSGTRPVADIRPGSDSSEPRNFTDLDGQTLFGANGPSGYELWRTDGTAGGTTMVADIRSGSAGSGVYGLFGWDHSVLFWAAQDDDGYALWRSDGTAAGTSKLKEVQPSFGGRFVAWGDQVFFAARDAAGSELWRTDGTAEGTVMVRDLYEGPLSSDPTNLVLAGPDGPLYFVAEEPQAGREIWALHEGDRSPVLVADVARGERSSRPDHLTMLGGSLVFVADDGGGVAPYRLGDPPDLVAPSITCPGDVSATAADNAGVAVTFPAPEATDDRGTATVSADWSSGDVFPVGTTVVTATATDKAGNTTSCTFQVVVLLWDGGAGGTPGEPEDGGCAAAGAGGSPAATWLLLVVAGMLFRGGRRGDQVIRRRAATGSSTPHSWR